MSDTAFLVLENGRIFEGKSFGAPIESIDESGITGEIVFSTGMIGYLETLSDPTSFGQIVVQTFPLIGNYGVISDDFESETITVRACIVKNWCEEPSNFRCEGDLDAFFMRKNILGLCNLDTRTITSIIRENGTMNAKIVRNPLDVDSEWLKAYKATGLVEEVSTKQPFSVEIDSGQIAFNVAVLDFGVKKSLLNQLNMRGCCLNVLPFDTSLSDISDLNPDGIVLSNGPGDPLDNPIIIENLKSISKLGIPIFGVGLGHQLLALSFGFECHKLKYGHRGANQSIQSLDNGRVYITGQNHGYAVLSSSINKSIAKEKYINLNDKTCEGIEYTNIPAFSVQFHPGAAGGPYDTDFLFDEFINMMEVYKSATR